jgi:hypothetical protein
LSASAVEDFPGLGVVVVLSILRVGAEDSVSPADQPIRAEWLGLAPHTACVCEISVDRSVRA